MPDTVSNNDTASLNGLYHDIYDFSLFPVSLGDIITWGVKSALRAEAAGRAKVHVHLICDPHKSGFNAFQSLSYLVDLLVVEVLPAFYSHPRFSGVTVHRSREDFLEGFARIAETDEAASRLLGENQAHYEERRNFVRTILYFSQQCTFHHDINDYFERTGTYPHVSFLEDCLVDWRALQSQYPKETFWVCVQFRLRRLDAGMPTSMEGFDRDAPFLAWFEFIKTAATRFPFVRFVLLGRLQEKPLELLRLPNVVVLRPLGMGLAHEITALLNCDHFLGSPSGFAQAAHFSDTPYDVYSCDEAGCKNYGIAYGTPNLPHATDRQVMHFKKETAALLLGSLERALATAPRAPNRPGLLDVHRTTSTDRFFLTDAQSDGEMLNILSTRLLAAARSVESGDLADAQRRIAEMTSSLPNLTAGWAEFKWLQETVSQLVKLATPDLPPEQAQVHQQLLIAVSRYCHPIRLIRRLSRFFDNVLVSEGFRGDGWCEKRARIVFAPSVPGDYMVIYVKRLSSSQPQRCSFQINRQKPLVLTLLNELSVVEIPIREMSIPTELVIESEYARTVDARYDTPFSILIEEAGLASELWPAPAHFRADKHDPRELAMSGILSDGWCSDLVRVRLDNPLPEGTAAMVKVAGLLPPFRRSKQHFSIQVNDQEIHEATISGKHFSADVPFAASSRPVFVTLRLPGREKTEAAARDFQARIRFIEIVPAAVSTAVIRSGLRGRLHRIVEKQRARRRKR